jgi:hypothetical protein
VYADASDHRVRRPYTVTLASETTTPHVLRYLHGDTIRHTCDWESRWLALLQFPLSPELQAEAQEEEAAIPPSP